MLHEPACKDLGTHIVRERRSSAAMNLPISVFLRLAVAEYDRETAPQTLQSVDAVERLHELFSQHDGPLDLWTESELRFADGDR